MLECRCDALTVGGNYETARLAAKSAWNTTYRSYVDIIIDPSEDPAFANPLSSSGFLPDGVHWSAVGANIVGAQYAAPAILSYINSH